MIIDGFFPLEDRNNSKKAIHLFLSSDHFKVVKIAEKWGKLHEQIEDNVALGSQVLPEKKLLELVDSIDQSSKPADVVEDL